MYQMYIKESFVYALPDREAACNGTDCGYWRGNNDHSYGGFDKLRMFKVNGAQICEGCLEEWKLSIEEALEEEEFKN